MQMPPAAALLTTFSAQLYLRPVLSQYPLFRSILADPHLTADTRWQSGDRDKCGLLKRGLKPLHTNSSSLTANLDSPESGRSTHESRSTTQPRCSPPRTDSGCGTNTYWTEWTVPQGENKCYHPCARRKRTHGHPACGRHVAVRSCDPSSTSRVPAPRRRVPSGLPLLRLQERAQWPQHPTRCEQGR